MIIKAIGTMQLKLEEKVVLDLFNVHKTNLAIAKNLRRIRRKSLLFFKFGYSATFKASERDTLRNVSWVSSTTNLC